MKHRITLIPGDGIGPEVIDATRRFLDAAGAEIEWEEVEAGSAAMEKYGTPLPDIVLDSIKRNGVALKGPITTPVGEGFSSVNVSLRKQLNLFANVRPISSKYGISLKFQNVDMVIIRENTEDVYAGLEQDIAPGVAQTLKIITTVASDRIAKFAFDYARKEGRKTVHAVHKANIMKKSDGLFLKSCREIAKGYPGIEYKEIIVDNCAMQMVMNPEQFDVLVLTNLYGDIISDLGAGLVGGLGLVPGANYGNNLAVFEAVHGSAPDIAGQNKANPLAVMLSAEQMMRYLGEEHVANHMKHAIIVQLTEKTHLTADMGGSATTGELTDALISEIVQ
ncbi:MAG: NAD-dependent isocitrate dehydrogenase [Calditrichaeota bacterium]|nr:NAD-dependent isocitrate dehydrogenase [Calditrichota bacterium]RQW03950.1 MAG: NAD-dependent isocitrate dehydrogenase [Calditrichota bacterium]